MEFWVRKHKQYYQGLRDDNDIKRAAYLTLRKIIREGLKPRPFFFPALRKSKQLLINRLKNILRQEVRR
jgi:hypothetical protein